jgi:hypothetical protein
MSWFEFRTMHDPCESCLALEGLYDEEQEKPHDQCQCDIELVLEDEHLYWYEKVGYTRVPGSYENVYEFDLIVECCNGLGPTLQDTVEITVDLLEHYGPDLEDEVTEEEYEGLLTEMHDELQDALEELAEDCPSCDFV